eukprot:s1005_g23.t1
MQQQNTLHEHNLLALVDFENAVPCVQVLCVWILCRSTKHPSLVEQQDIADSCREEEDKFSAENKETPNLFGDSNLDRETEEADLESSLNLHLISFTVFNHLSEDERR